MRRYTPAKRRARKKKAKRTRKQKPAEERVTRKKKTATKKTTANRRQKTAKKRTASRRQTTAKKAAVKKGAAKKRVAVKKPVAKKPVAKKPVAKKPVAKKPAAKKRSASTRVQKQISKARSSQPKLRSPKKGERREAQAAVRRKTKKVLQEEEAKRLKDYGAPPLPKAKARDLQHENFERLMKIARKSKQVPVGNFRSRKIDSKRNVGERRTVNIDDYVTDDSIEQILYEVSQRIRGMSGVYARWMATIALSSFGASVFGSGIHILIADDPDAALFQSQVWESTGAKETKDGMMASLRHELETFVDRRTIVWCHFIEVRNFSARVFPKR